MDTEAGGRLAVFKVTAEGGLLEGRAFHIQLLLSYLDVSAEQLVTVTQLRGPEDGGRPETASMALAQPLGRCVCQAVRQAPGGHVKHGKMMSHLAV